MRVPGGLVCCSWLAVVSSVRLLLSVVLAPWVPDFLNVVQKCYQLGLVHGAVVVLQCECMYNAIQPRWPVAEIHLNGFGLHALSSELLPPGGCGRGSTLFAGKRRCIHSMCQASGQEVKRLSSLMQPSVECTARCQLVPAHRLVVRRAAQCY